MKGTTMKYSPRALTFALSCLLPFSGLLTASTQADVLQIPVGQQAKDHWDIARPSKGMSKAQVQTTFGTALEKKAAAGNPPISSWVYEDYVVYFESDYVIHTVLNHHPVAQAQNQHQSN
jgi:hypothetical protein